MAFLKRNEFLFEIKLFLFGIKALMETEIVLFKFIPAIFNYKALCWITVWTKLIGIKLLLMQFFITFYKKIITFFAMPYRSQK